MRRLVRCVCGAAATEFAIVLPVAMLMGAGVTEIGGLVQVMNATNELSSQYAIAWADCTDNPAGTCTTEVGYYAAAPAIANLAPCLTQSALTLQMFEVTMAGTTPQVQIASPSSATLSSAQVSAAQAAFSNGQTGVIVTATYVNTLQFFPTLMAPFLGKTQTISYTVTQLKG
jgi:hypothetical protein